VSEQPEEEQIEYVIEPPAPCEIWDGGCTIFQPAQFEEDFNCYAAQMFEGNLLVLDKKSREWLNVVPEKKSKAKLKIIEDK
jgi:hypothetical protein